MPRNGKYILKFGYKDTTFCRHRQVLPLRNAKTIIFLPTYTTPKTTKSPTQNDWA